MRGRSLILADPISERRLPARHLLSSGSGLEWQALELREQLPDDAGTEAVWRILG
jgi:hypothetical protein